MRKPIYIFIFLFFTILCYGQETDNSYDSTLASSLGADEYGMKTYILVILKTGTNDTRDETKLDSLFRGHMNNINRLADLGKLVVAGPLFKNEKEYRGIFILDVVTKEEAVKLLESDPVIKEKVMDVELYNWYGSAALPVYLKTHGKIEKLKH